MKDYYKEFDRIMNIPYDTEKDALSNEIKIWKLKKKFVEECSFDELNESYKRGLFHGVYGPLCKFHGINLEEDTISCSGCIINSCGHTPWNLVIIGLRVVLGFRYFDKEARKKLLKTLDDEITYLESILKNFKLK